MLFRCILTMLLLFETFDLFVPVCDRPFWFVVYHHWLRLPSLVDLAGVL